MFKFKDIVNLCARESYSYRIINSLVNLVAEMIIINEHIYEITVIKFYFCNHIHIIISLDNDIRQDIVLTLKDPLMLDKIKYYVDNSMKRFNEIHANIVPEYCIPLI